MGTSSTTPTGDDIDIDQEKVCPLAPAMDVIAGKWKAEIAWNLCDGTARRFNELRRLIGKVTPKMLAQQLREMERDGIITRTQFNEIPPRVEYQITDLGQTLGPLFSALAEWGYVHNSALDTARVSYDKSMRTVVP
ncbi:MAG: helix-turn-helix transcriptional regulator [Actinobacteria bacterium]|nr:helix-turn-helix transcriptional regulator [Actinomycetota bacterium]